MIESDSVQQTAGDSGVLGGEMLRCREALEHPMRGNGLGLGTGW